MTCPPVYRISPLEDPRWTTFLQGHPRASVFHSAEWLEALHRTYGYDVTALTTAAPGETLQNGLVYCLVQSWLTGRRIVSLPFSDHCEPLVANEEELERLTSVLKHESNANRRTHVEIRTMGKRDAPPADFEEAPSLCFHRLSLRPSEEELFHALHKDCVQRKIRRAHREGLVCEEGRSETLLQQFYQLLLVTRRRQGVPPQPIAWFRNLIACVGHKLTIHVAYKDGYPVASILTLRHKGTLVYKYGCSDRAVSNLGGMQMLMWKAIADARRDGLHEFDMGRSDRHDHGLIEFKDRWGAARSELAYLQYPSVRSRPNVTIGWMRVAGQILAVAPRGLITTTARFLYRHLGCL